MDRMGVEETDLDSKRGKSGLGNCPADGEHSLKEPQEGSSSHQDDDVVKGASTAPVGYGQPRR